jgi:hypothetical protein
MASIHNTLFETLVGDKSQENQSLPAKKAVQVCKSNNPSHLSTHLLFQLYIQSSTESGWVSLSLFEMPEK